MDAADYPRVKALWERSEGVGLSDPSSKRERRVSP